MHYRHGPSHLPPTRLYLLNLPYLPEMLMLRLNQWIHPSMKPQPLEPSCFQKPHQIALRPSTNESLGNMSHQSLVYVVQRKCWCVINTSYRCLTNPYTRPAPWTIKAERVWCSSCWYSIRNLWAYPMDDRVLSDTIWCIVVAQGRCLYVGSELHFRYSLYCQYT